MHEVDFGSTEPIDDVSRIKRYAPRIFGSDVDYQHDPKILGAQHFIAETSSIGILDPKSISCTSRSLGEFFY